MKIKTTAWLASPFTQQRFFRAIENNDNMMATQCIAFSDEDMTNYGWVKIGTVDIELTMYKLADVKHMLLYSLEKEKQDIEMKINELDPRF